MTTRRRFLQTSATLAAVTAFTRCGGGSAGSSPGSGTPPPPPPSAKNILVLVQLQGGNDGLSTLVPVSGTNATLYRSYRPVLGIPADRLADVGGGLAFTKDLLGFEALQASGRVAWIPGIGMPNPNLSHFTSTDVWGMGAATPQPTGWLGRWGDATFAATDVLRGIALTSDLLQMVQGARRDFVSITSTGDFAFPAWLRSASAVPDAALLGAAYQTALAAATQDPLAAKAAGDGQLWYDAQKSFQSLIKPRTPAVPYPGDATFPVANLSRQLSSQLKLVAQMIASDIPAQVYTVRLGGFDTHSAQTTDHPRLMGALGGAISAFYDDLAAITTPAGPAQDRVLIAAWSEFGRRVKENNGGTDHGAAGLAFVVGKPVRGGVHGGGHPDLASLDSYGNLKYTTDFRSYYATLIDKWLGGSSETILGGKYPTLGFL